jgi:hypothetical protein
LCGRVDNLRSLERDHQGEEKSGKSWKEVLKPFEFISDAILRSWGARVFGCFMNKHKDTNMFDALERILVDRRW